MTWGPRRSTSSPPRQMKQGQVRCPARPSHARSGRRHDRPPRGHRPPPLLRSGDGLGYLLMGAGEATAVTPAARPKQRGRFAAWFRRYRFEIVLITPLIAYILLFTFAPIIDTFRRSFSAPERIRHAQVLPGHLRRVFLDAPVRVRGRSSTRSSWPCSRARDGDRVGHRLALDVAFFGRASFGPCCSSRWVYRPSCRGQSCS